MTSDINTLDVGALEPLTKVLFHFIDPNGLPMANRFFEIQLAESNFVDEDGVLMPKVMYVQTDEEGKYLAKLRESKKPYYVLMEGDTPQDVIAYTFYVPKTDVVVRAQDLFIAVPPSEVPYDEEAIRLLTEYKVDARNSADNAKESEDKAKASEIIAVDAAADAGHSLSLLNDEVDRARAHADASETSRQAADASKEAAKTSETNAKVSETSAANSATASNTAKTAAEAARDVAITKATEATNSAQAAKGSQIAAKASEDAAKDSEVSAKAAETSATSSATIATTKASEASSSAAKAKTSETNAKASEVAAKASETAAKTSEVNAKASETIASDKATIATTKANEASTSATKALASEGIAKTSEINAKNSETAAKASENAAASSAQAALASEGNAQASATAAEASATAASISADESAASASLSADSASVAVTAKDEAVSAKDIAANASESALASADNAGNSMDLAQVAASEAKASETTAELSKNEAISARNTVIGIKEEVISLNTLGEGFANLAKQWATAPEDVKVDGNEYSAYHWYLKTKKLNESVNPETVVTTDDVRLRISSKLGNALAQEADGQFVLNSKVAWDNDEKTLTFSDNLGNTYPINLSQFLSDVYVDNASFDPLTSILRLERKNESGEVIDPITIDLGELSKSAVANSNAIHMEGNGTGVTPLKASLVLSPDSENLLEIRNNGLYVKASPELAQLKTLAFKDSADWNTDIINRPIASLAKADNSVQKDANLGDLTNPATARSNLGLGSAATRDVVSYNTDTSGGDKVVTQGWMGLGSVDASKVTDVDQVGYTSFLRTSGASTKWPSGNPSPNANGNLLTFSGFNNPAREFPDAFQVYANYGGNPKSVYFRFRRENELTPWEEVTHSGNLRQATGSSTDYPMSQKAVTDELELLTERVDKLHNYHNVSWIFGPTDAGGMWDASLLAPGEATTLPNIMGGSASSLTSVGNVGSVVTVMGAQVLRSVTGSAYESTEPILPPNAPFTFSASFQVPDGSRAALFYQQQAGADGRLQLWANGELNAAGTGIIRAPGKLKLFVGGAPEQLETADITPNVPFDLVLTMNGAGEGKLYVNGRLISTRQNMPSVVDVTSSIFGDASASGNGLLFGRAFVIDRVVSEEELRAIRLWVSQGFVSNFTSKRPFKEPDITAVSAYSMVLPAYGGRVVSGAGILFRKDPDTPIPPASTTKVLTCVTVSKIATTLGLGTNNYFRNTTATVQSSDITSGSGNNLLTGDAISLYDLMANTLITSSNTSATVLARTFGTILLESEGQASPSPAQAVARFVAEMNSVALSLGMVESTFVNPHGLHNSSQLTTARDLALLGVEAMYHTSIAELWGQSAYTLSVTREGVSTPIGIVSSNAMADDFDILGGKTGNLTGITSNFLVVSRAPGGNIVCTVVMGSANPAARFTDARAVIDSVNSGYTWPQTQPF